MRFFALASLLLGWSVCAHEFGTVQVDVSFARDGKCHIELSVDVEHIILNLGPAPDWTPPVPVPAGVLDRYGAFLRDYLLQSVITFDWIQVAPVLESVQWSEPTPEGKKFLLLRLSVELPRGARVFVWSNTSKMGTYLLKLRQEGQEEIRKEWLDPRQESRPYPIDPSLAPGRPIGLWLAGLGGACGVAGLAWMAKRRRS